MKAFINILALIIFSSSLAYTQKVDKSYFDEVDDFLKSTVTSGLIDYAKAKTDPKLNVLISKIETADLTDLSEDTKKAFLINAYNLNVIQQITESYPTTSPMDISGFFDSKKIIVGGDKMSLNTLEKDHLLKPYGDARYHFVLVCGAVGCPPITDFAYTPEDLDDQLDTQTKLAINNPEFIKVKDNKVELSQIFKWYVSDFGGSKNRVVDYINKYKTTPIDSDAKVSYYQYNWALNDYSKKKDESGLGAANAIRYIVSSTIKKGTIESKIFNNLYSQKTGSEGDLRDRSTFFTTSINVLYGLNNRFNIGFATRFRRVRNQSLPSSAFEVFGSDDVGSARTGLTAFGPQIRYAPVPSWENFSIQSSLVFPIGSDLAGSDTQPYIDWNGATWNTQFFNDIPIGNNFSLFTEFDLIVEDIGNSYLFSTPVTAILSYNPTQKTILYALSGFSPYWQANIDYFAQAGLGAKYQITQKFELELLYTKFTNKYLSQNGGQAVTYNFGVRFNI